MIEWANSEAAKAGPAPLLFLFGAGASFGAVHVSPYPPPLGRDLYDELAQAFPRTWGAESWFAGRADDFGSDFETTMERCIEHNATSAVPALLDMANYFTQFEPDGDDLYSGLLLALQARSLIAQTVFCSLNYECVFEMAAIRLGIRLHYEGVDTAPVATTDVRVIKPHGSCNFLTRADRSPMPYLLTGSMVEAGITAENPERARKTLAVLAAEPVTTRGRYVVISNYASSKSTPLSPAQITQVRMGFASRVQSAATIIVIGARPNEHDTHVWGPVRDCGSDVFYVGGDYANLRCSRAQLLAQTFHEAWEPLLRTLDAAAATGTAGSR